MSNAYYRFLPSLGAAMGGVVLPLTIAKSPAAVWEILRTGWVQRMSELSFVVFHGSLLGALLFLVPTLLIRKRMRIRQGEEPILSKKSVGIGGWLLIPACWFSLCPALHFFSAIHHVVIVQHYSPKHILTLDIINSLLLCLLGTVVCVSLLREMRFTRKIATVYFLVGLSYAVFRPLLSMALDAPKSLHTQLVLFLGPPWFVLVFALLILSAVWIPYFFRSERARGTFSR